MVSISCLVSVLCLFVLVIFSVSLCVFSFFLPDLLLGLFCVRVRSACSGGVQVGG